MLSGAALQVEIHLRELSGDVQVGLNPTAKPWLCFAQTCLCGSTWQLPSSMSPQRDISRPS